jgi:hypothetical protein
MLRRVGTKILGGRLRIRSNCCGCAPRRAQPGCGHGINVLQPMPMPQIFRPYADSVARATSVTLLIGPFAAIGIAYWTVRSSCSLSS